MTKIAILLIFIGVAVLQSCHLECGKMADGYVDTLSFEKINIEDSVSFPTSVGVEGVAVARVSATLPVSGVDSVALESVRHFLAEWILPGDSSCDNREVAGRYVKALLERYSEDVVISSDDDRELVKMVVDTNRQIRMVVSSRIYPVWNKAGLLTMCKESIIRYNEDTPSTEHVYLNFNLLGKRRVTLDDVFREESLPLLSSLIKNRLLGQRGVKSEEDMIEEGFFNLENLSVNNNFRIGSCGLTWTFLPLEIACFRVGEVEVMLTYDELLPLMAVGNNALNKMVEDGRDN